MLENLGAFYPSNADLICIFEAYFRHNVRYAKPITMNRSWLPSRRVCSTAATIPANRARFLQCVLLHRRLQQDPMRLVATLIRFYVIYRNGVSRRGARPDTYGLMVIAQCPSACSCDSLYCFVYSSCFARGLGNRVSGPLCAVARKHPVRGFVHKGHVTKTSGAAWIERSQSKQQ